jgi:hypothetical protein
MRQLQRELAIVKTFSDNIRMEFGPDKNAPQQFSSMASYLKAKTLV